MIKAHYGLREDLGSNLGKSTSWEGKSNYIRKELVYFPSNKNRDTHGKFKKKKSSIFN